MHMYVCYIPSLFTTWVPCLLNNLYIPTPVRNARRSGNPSDINFKVN